MTKWGKRLFSIAFSFMFLFISIGYAQLADTLVVQGTASWQYKGVYITSISTVRSTGVTENAEVSYFIPTNVITDLNATGEANTTREIVYKVTVTNNTNYKYSYKGISCDTQLDGYQNDLYNAANGFTVGVYTDAACTVVMKPDDSSVKDDETPVEAGGTLDFYVKYTFKNTVAKNTEVKALLGYSFDVHIDSLGDMAAAQAASKFLNTLNNQETYTELTTNIDNKFENPETSAIWGDANGNGYLDTGWRQEKIALELWRANYIGNVAGSSDSDKQVVQDMLEGLQITIDGDTHDLKAIIKRINVDGNTNTGDAYTASFTYTERNQENFWSQATTTEKTFSLSDSGCEMVLYMTADNLDFNVDPGEYGKHEDANWARVYIIVLTCKNNGVINDDGTTKILSEWYQMGDIYEGICQIVDYGGGTGSGGSFNTESWKSLEKTYNVTDKYSYDIPMGNGRGEKEGQEDEDIVEILAIPDPAANTEFTRLKTEADALMVQINAGYFNNSAFTSVVSTMKTVYTKAEDIEAGLTAQTKRAELIQIIKELDSALYPFRDHS